MNHKFYRHAALSLILITVLMMYLIFEKLGIIPELIAAVTFSAIISWGDIYRAKFYRAAGNNEAMA